jgi:hypothetical protein
VIVTGLLMFGSKLAGVIVCAPLPRLKLIVSPVSVFALMMAARSVPAAVVSAVEVTLIAASNHRTSSGSIARPDAATV